MAFTLDVKMSMPRVATTPLRFELNGTCVETKRVARLFFFWGGDPFFE